MINYTINGNVVTVFDEDFVPVSIDSSHPNYHEVMDELHDSPFDEFDLHSILELMKPIETVRKAVAGNTDIEVTDSAVYFKGAELHGVLVDRILGGDKVDHLVAFLGKLMGNPSYRAVNELYGFLERNNHAILSDGNFVAYKIVTQDYKDLYTNQFDNSPGTTVSVPRNLVDEDCNRTCSHGLHVCGFEYLDKYGAVRNGTDRVVAVSINPANVVAVPVDYNNAKMRVSEYTVLNDITDKVKLDWTGCLGYGQYEYDPYSEEEDDFDYEDEKYAYDPFDDEPIETDEGWYWPSDGATSYVKHRKYY